MSCIAGAIAAPVEQQQAASESNKDLETAEGQIRAYGGGLGYGARYGGHGFGHGGEHNFEIDFY